MYIVYILVYFKISLHVEMYVKCYDLSLFHWLIRGVMTLLELHFTAHFPLENLHTAVMHTMEF